MSLEEPDGQAMEMNACISSRCKLWCLEYTEEIVQHIHDNITYTFDDWANPVAHLLLPKELHGQSVEVIASKALVIGATPGLKHSTGKIIYTKALN